ncbi:hypothetical protein LG634_04535 [Streptomyces bambusae]|uniref:DUF7144 family membrane protein n=1 Tax=Streptomyces bambusae TaxID=1550616 RepID=UPI001CFD2356|nr:hypothetical protein [Streptomyces bambusae]MCB5164103.1 hypothetical protein [Streptomyces bambusae]
MANTAPGTPAPPRGPAGGPERNAWAAGGTLFAGVLMLTQGIFGVLAGIAGIAGDDVYARVGNYVFEFNLDAWGWIHLILGVLVAITGWGILQGAEWARGAGIGLAVVVMIAQFMWLPYTPWWALLSIALSVFVIWALCTDRGSAADG